MKKVLLVDESIDKIGGVERVVNTLSNNIYDKYDFSLTSLTKNSDKTFYKYNENVKINYFLDRRNFKSNQYSKGTFLYYFYRFFEKIKMKIVYNKNIKNFCKKISNDSILIFGRVQITPDFFKYLEKYNKHPKIIIRDSIHLTWYPDPIKKCMKKYFPEFVNTFIVSSDESMEEYKDFFGTDRVNMVKIYNPLGIIPKSCGDYEYKKVVSIGRMNENQKGFSALIKAFEKVSKVYPDWKLELYGDGCEKKEYENLINKLNLNNNVFLMQSAKDVVSVFEKSSMFVLASRFEGYANILVEAMACGMPSISFDWLSGVDDIIDDKKNGIVVRLKDRKRYYSGIDDEEDINNLANSIIELISNKEYMEKLSIEAQKIANCREQSIIVNKWIDMIEQTN